MKVRCQRCEGTRRIMVLGGIKKECDVCKGNGFTDEPEKLVDESKRAVRKPKDEDESSDRRNS